MVGLSGAGAAAGKMSAEDQARLWGEIAANPERYKKYLDEVIARTKAAEAAEKAAKEERAAAIKQLDEAHQAMETLDAKATEHEAWYAGVVSAMDRRQANLDSREAKLNSLQADIERAGAEANAALSERERVVSEREREVGAREAALHSRVAALDESEKQVAALDADLRARYAALRRIVNEEPGR